MTSESINSSASLDSNKSIVLSGQNISIFFAGIDRIFFKFNHITISFVGG